MSRDALVKIADKSWMVNCAGEGSDARMTGSALTHRVCLYHLLSPSSRLPRPVHLHQTSFQGYVAESYLEIQGVEHWDELMTCSVVCVSNSG